jgi:hypothetical protein
MQSIIMLNKFLELLTLHANDFKKNQHLLKNNLIIVWNGKGYFGVNTTLEISHLETQIVNK